MSVSPLTQNQKASVAEIVYSIRRRLGQCREKQFLQYLPTALLSSYVQFSKKYPSNFGRRLRQFCGCVKHSESPTELSQSYVYVLLDSRKPGRYKYGSYVFNFEPFYVGKGIGNRIEHHEKRIKACKNLPKDNKIRKILREGYTIEHKILKRSMSDNQACVLEIKLIKLIGRGRNGPLTNLTDGGDGLLGRKHTAASIAKCTAIQHSRSKKEKAVISAKLHAANDNRTEKEKAVISEKIRNKRVASIANGNELKRNEKVSVAWANKTTRERRATAAKKLTAWQSKTQAERDSIIAKRVASMKARTIEEKEATKKKFQESWGNMDQKVAKRRSSAISKAQKIIRGKETANDKAARIQKMKATNAAKPKSEHEARSMKISERTSAGHAARTISDKIKSSRLMSKAAAQRTPEQKKAIADKKRATWSAKYDYDLSH